MLDEPHDLASELPEHGHRIRELADRDGAFRTLLAEYDTLDGQIQELELSGTPVADATAEDLKKQRLSLKDRLFEQLIAPAPA